MKENSFLQEAAHYMSTIALHPNDAKHQHFISDLMDQGAKYDVTSGAKSRSELVGTQAAIELLISNMMRQQKLKAASCIIHTVRPSTPLLVNGGDEVSKQLVSEPVMQKLAQRKTVTDRVRSVRKMLAKEVNMPVVALYQSSSLAGLTTEQTLAFENNKARFPTLEDRPVADFLEGNKNKFSGATYVVEDNQGKRFAYSIQAYQANTNDEVQRKWGVWCGEYKEKESRQTEADHAVGNRIDELQQEIFKPNNIDIEALLDKSRVIGKSSEIGR